MSRTRESGAIGRRFVMVLVALAVLFCGVPAASAQDGQGNGKISREVVDQIRGSAPDDLLPVIIQTRGEPSASHFTRLHGRGGMVKAQHLSIRGYTAQVPASQLDGLSDDPEIERISMDAPVTAHLDVAWKAVNGEVALVDFDGIAGLGVGIGVIDTGVQGHPDLLRPKGAPQVIEVEVVGHENDLADYYGHGTHVAGILNGNGAASSDRNAFRTFRGVAPGAQIISIRSLAPDGTGYTSDIIAGIDWAIRYKSAYNIRVLNLSLGHPVFESYTTDPLCRAVKAAHDAGILVVVAAGNDGRIGSGFGTITTPANEPTALTVGAMDDSDTVTTTDDILAPYSSKGPSLIDFVVKPDIVAPGTYVVSARAVDSFLDTNYHQFALKMSAYRIDPSGIDKDGQYFELSGTSMAAPMVAGTAALMFQKDPPATPATIKARLMKSAVKDTLLMFETGAGYLDIDAALKATGVAKSADSPTAVLASDGYVYVDGTSIIWGIDWTLAGVWGGGKGKNAAIDLLDVSDEILAAYGGVWGNKGKCALGSAVENDAVTSSGLIWDAMGSSLSSTTGTVDTTAGVWGGGKKH